jgi:hypothetical protein
VEKKMKAFGTGFLVGANLVMTNHHVVEDLLQGRTSPKDFTLRFDFRRDRDGVTVRAGTAVNLHQNWLVHSSPRHSSDTEVNPQSEPSGDQLDFAVIRTEGSPGNNPIQGQRASPDEKRGWITMEVADVAVPAGQTMIILQHPNGQPLQIAFGQALARNRTQTRQRYHVNTEAGSSGSPCFSMDLKLSLLHHAGDPNFDRAAAFNQGIPLAAIRESLRRAGHLSKIGVDEIT